MFRVAKEENLGTMRLFFSDEKLQL